MPPADLRLAHLSDLHVGGMGWRRRTIARAIQVCNREELDLIVITGDLIGSDAGTGAAMEILSLLRRDVPRLAVLGNHDHVHGGRSLAALRRGLDRLGVTVLCNDVTCLDLPSGPVWFAGVDDGYSMRDDLDLVRSKMGNISAPRILLTHYPDVADRLRPGEFQLSLAGHSHGGQIRMPLLDRLVYNSHARTRFGRGLYMVNGNPLYVSSGLGMSGVPFRFRNWPEMGLLTLPLIY
jgi:predicted MPP superfamily phosphohydrolase